MKITRPCTLIAKLKYIIGLSLTLATMLAFVTTDNRNISTDRVFFQVSPKLTTESTEVCVKVTNKSIYGISKDIFVNGIEKEENGEWVKLELGNPGSYPAIARPYYESCIFPTETVNLSIPCDSLFGQETAPKGNYRITLIYYIYHSVEDSYTTCEFSVD